MTIRALTAEEKCHPAKYSTQVIGTLIDLTGRWLGTAHDLRDNPISVLDPYAGVGWIHRLASLGMVTFAVELEHEWARNQGHAGRTIQADAGDLAFAESTFEAVITSAVYPNRMRDHHLAKDTSERKTYTHQFRKLVDDNTVDLHPTNMGAMTNKQYRDTAQRHIREFKRVTISGGLMFLNMSNSIAGDDENNAVEQWINWLTLADCHIREVRPVSTRRLKYGANHDARVEHEVVIVAQFPVKASQPTLL